MVGITNCSNGNINIKNGKIEEYNSNSVVEKNHFVEFLEGGIYSLYNKIIEELNINLNNIIDFISLSDNLKVLLYDNLNDNFFHIQVIYIDNDNYELKANYKHTRLLKSLCLDSFNNLILVDNNILEYDIENDSLILLKSIDNFHYEYLKYGYIISDDLLLTLEIDKDNEYYFCIYDIDNFYNINYIKSIGSSNLPFFGIDQKIFHNKQKNFFLYMIYDDLEAKGYYIGTFLDKNNKNFLNFLYDDNSGINYFSFFEKDDLLFLFTKKKGEKFDVAIYNINTGSSYTNSYIVNDNTTNEIDNIIDYFLETSYLIKDTSIISFGSKTKLLIKYVVKNSTIDISLIDSYLNFITTNNYNDNIYGINNNNNNKISLSKINYINNTIVTDSINKIDGLTKTKCTPSSPGKVWVLKE